MHLPRFLLCYNYKGQSPTSEICRVIGQNRCVILKVMFVSVQFKLDFENKQDREKVLSLMRLQSSAVRFIYNRLREGKKQTKIYKLVKEIFKIPSWYISSALQKAKSLKVSQSAWRVLRSALVLPLLEKSFTRDFSPLKSVIIEGKWQRRASRLVPFGFWGTMRRNTG